MPAVYRYLFVAGMTCVSAVFVAFWQSQRSRSKLMSLFLFACSMLMCIGYMMGLAVADLWWPPTDALTNAGSLPMFVWNSFRGEIVVHAIFTTLFVISIAGAWKILNRDSSSCQRFSVLPVWFHATVSCGALRKSDVPDSLNGTY